MASLPYSERTAAAQVVRRRGAGLSRSDHVRLNWRLLLALGGNVVLWGLIVKAVEAAT